MRQTVRMGVVCLFAMCAVPGSAAVILTPTDDTYVQSDNSGPYGTSDILRVKWNNNDDGYHRKAWFQFDLLTVGGSLTGATLDLPFINTGLGADPSGNWDFQVYGLTDETLDGWSEGVIRWVTAPGNDPGNPYTAGNTVDPTKTVSLGTFTVNGTGDGTTFSIGGAALESFLAGDTNDLATFILVRDTRGTASKTYVHGVPSKEHASAGPATLNLPNAVAVVPPHYAADDFSYALGDLNGAAGGTGWLGGWSASTAHENVVAPALPLQYRQGDGAVHGGDTALAITGNADPNPLATRSLRQTWSDDDVYISFLLRWAQGSVDQNDFVSVYFGSQSGPNIGIKGNMDTGNPANPDFVARLSSAAGESAYFENITDDTTYFIIGHLMKSGAGNYDTFELWVNPDYDAQGIPDVIALGNAGISSFNLIGLRSVNLDAGELVLLDALRLGTTWAEVFPQYVPEPASLGLLGAGLLALARRRRRTAA